MKKIVSAIALCAAASTFAADAVYSANIVGFQKMDFVPGYNFVGVNFESSSSDDKSHSIQNIFDVAELNGGTSQLGSDQMLLWDASAQQYKRYWLFNSGTGHALDGKWLTWDSPTEATEQIAAGDGFWFINSGDANVSVTMSGDVKSADDFSHEMSEGYNMVASAYPVTQSVNEMEWNGYVGGTSQLASDQLVFWDADTQQYVRVWLFDSSTGHALDGKWLTWDSPAESDAEIKAGTAVWAIRKTASDVDEIKPF